MIWILGGCTDSLSILWSPPLCHFHDPINHMELAERVAFLSCEVSVRDPPDVVNWVWVSLMWFVWGFTVLGSREKWSSMTHYFIKPWVVWSILPQWLSFQESSLSMQTTNKEKQNHEKLCFLEIREHRPMWVAHYTTNSPCETF